MPAFRILYTTARTDHAITEAIEWVTPGNYDRERARRAFEREFPGAAVIQCRELESC